LHTSYPMSFFLDKFRGTSYKSFIAIL
jgi:hypothetical protein